MRRAPGWIVLAGIALELTALALAVRILPAPRRRIARSGSAGVLAESAPHAFTPPTAPGGDDALTFVSEGAGEQTRRYRAADADVQLFVGFYGDGRVRVADALGNRYAGALESGRAELLDLKTHERSELLVRVTPTGRMQLELRGGPHDGRVLNCETISA